MKLEELKKISFYLGKNKNLTQCAGGNTSLKSSNYMFIKSSGMWLEDAYIKNIFSKINTNKINNKIKLCKDISENDYIIVGHKKNKVSIETPLHLQLINKFVIHYHPVNLNAILIQKDGFLKLKKVLKINNWIYVKYAKPGNELYKKVGEKLKTTSNKIQVIFLQNHGIVIGADTFKECINKINYFEKMFQTKENEFKLNTSKIQKYAKLLNMKTPKYKKINSLATNNISYKVCSTKTGILFPDQAVFLGNKMECITEKEIPNYINSDVRFLIIKNIGVLISKNSKVEINEILLFMSKVLLKLNNSNNLNYLSKKNINALINWDAEKYRLQLSR